MRCYRILALLGALAVALPVASAESVTAASTDKTVILLHGLGRTSRAMACLVAPLEQAGFTVHNIGYPSRSKAIPELADGVAAELAALGLTKSPVHAVTHSMGGIVLRQLVASDQIKVAHAVMFSPPNHGSEVIDHLRGFPGFKATMGPAALQLHTGDGSLPNSLGPATFPLGIIAGTSSYNPLFSNWIAGDDDGKVSVDSARLDGMAAFAALPLNHTRMMCNDRAQDYVLSFLRSGAFPDSE